MSNQVLLLQKLGFNIEEIEKEGFDVELVLSDFSKKQEDLYKNRSDILQPMKDKATKEASIIATKKAKKAIVKAFGLSVTDSELQEVETDVLLTKGIENIRTGTSAEVTELQNKIIALTADYTSKVEAKEQELKDKELALLNDIKREKVNAFLNRSLYDKEYLVDNELAHNIFMTGIAADKFNLEPTESGVIVKKEDGLEALKPDNTAKIDIDYLKEKYLGKLIVKSKGSGQQQQQNKSIDDDAFKNIPEAMKENLQRLQGVVN